MADRALIRSGPPDIVRREGLPVTRLDDALVAAWPQLASEVRTAALVRAVNERMTLPERIASAVARTRRVADRVELVRLVTKLATGCRSYLELFGLDRVFTGPELDCFARQTVLSAGGRKYYLDLYAAKERVNVELDGASWHSSAQQREYDLQRDAALATRGVLVVRFSYHRVVADPDGVRREVLDILRSRR